jgi:hypothetical protein
MTIGDMVGLAMVFEAKHEGTMTGRPLISRLPTSSPRPNHRLTRHPLRTTALGTILAVLLTLAGYPTGTAYARTIYDGAWSVLIVTMSGSCDPSYRYGVRINDGIVTYDGIAPIDMRGRVTPKGAVRVIVQSGSQWADGTGKMTRNRGGGIWRGQGMGSACAGTWQAERRD